MGYNDIIAALSTEEAKELARNLERAAEESKDHQTAWPVRIGSSSLLINVVPYNTNYGDPTGTFADNQWD